MVGNRVDGDLQYEENRARMISRSTTVLSYLQVSKNTGGAVLKSNRVVENLQCGQNRPAPRAATTRPAPRKISAPG